jgi:hypothetical protein
MTGRRLLPLVACILFASSSNAQAAPPAAAAAGSASSSSSGAAGATASGATAGAPSTAAASGGGGTAAPSNTGAFLRVAKPTLFVLAYSSDSLSPAYITYEMADYLNAMTRRDTVKRAEFWVLPEPGWAISDFMTQCANDPNTMGALILYDTEDDTGIFNYVIYEENYTHLYSKALLVTCKSPFGPPENATQEIQTETKVTTGTSDAQPGTVVTQSKTNTYITPSPPPTPMPIGYSYTEHYATVTPTPTPIALPGSPAKVRLTSLDADRTPTPGKTPKPKTLTPTTWSQQSVVSAPTKLDVTTTTKTELPVMMIIWQNDKSLDADGIQGSIPFIGIAAIGGYLATREITRTATTQVTQNIAPGESVATTNTTMGNNSALPYGLALAAPALTSLGSINFGGANGNRVLKTAAARMASLLGRQWHDDCVDQTGKVLEDPGRYGHGECSFLFDKSTGIFDAALVPDYKLPCYQTYPSDALLMRGQPLCVP